MSFDLNNAFTILDAKNDFAEVSRIARENGQAIIIENEKPQYVLIDMETSPILDMTEDEKIDLVAARVLKRFRSAFLELAK